MLRYGSVAVTKTVSSAYLYGREGVLLLLIYVCVCVFWVCVWLFVCVLLDSMHTRSI